MSEVFRKLAAQRESRVEEEPLMPDPVYMMLSIPPKYAASQGVGLIKAVIRDCIENQENEEERLYPLGLWR